MELQNKITFTVSCETQVIQDFTGKDVTEAKIFIGSKYVYSLIEFLPSKWSISESSWFEGDLESAIIWSLVVKGYWK